MLAAFNETERVWGLFVPLAGHLSAFEASVVIIHHGGIIGSNHGKAENIFNPRLYGLGFIGKQTLL
jgi:hypothetical protein